MIPGPVYIIPCPICSFPGRKRSLTSGNTFGAVCWSDGKKVAPMLPKYPTLVKCKKCGTFFNAREKDSIAEYSLPGITFDIDPEIEKHSVSKSEEEENKWKHVDFFEFPSFLEYFEALGSDVTSEKVIRWMAFQSFNDYIRDNRNNEITIDMHDLYIDNLKSMLYLFSENDPGDLFTLIEINRQLGKFDRCRELLTKIDDTKGGILKKVFVEQVEKKNSQLFRIS